MNKWGLVLTAALAATLAAQPALAQESPGGFYIGLSGAASYTDAAQSMETFTGGIHDKSVPNGGKVYAGLVRDGWGMEFAYYYLGKIEIENAAGQVQDEMETGAIVVAGVYEAAIAPAYTFVARVGIAFTQARYDCKLACSAPFLDTKETGTSGMFGLGLDMRMTQSLALRMEYEHIGSVHHGISTIKFKDAYDLFSVGVRLAF
jgi:hypothetical protein